MDITYKQDPKNKANTLVYQPINQPHRPTHVGTIKPAGDGFGYFPKGKVNAMTIFPSVRAVKDSLEGTGPEEPVKPGQPQQERPKPKHGDLRVWWVPQMPMKSFLVPVKNAAEARLLLDALADYDLFQHENNIKPDYSNAGGLSVFDSKDPHDGPEGSWVDWYSDDGEDIDAYELDALRQEQPKWEGAES